ncbi:MAG: CoA transferase [Myxococcales bacterium]|nr:CoA transferase [Myxococcales bacterium]
MKGKLVMRPLEGIRVVDLADEKGELCGRLLADFGAEVIRIEPPEGAVSRSLGPFTPDGETSLYFAHRNAGKRGVVLDLTEAAGRESLHALLQDADFCIESFMPGTLAGLGLAPESLLERHPQLVLVSISDFGQTGPYRDYQGTDMIGFAMGGMMHRAGRIEKPPLVAPGALAYDTGGTTAAYAALVAFWQRLRTGQGQHVDVSVMESVMSLADWALPNYSKTQAVVPRAGAGIYSLYPCSDGFIRMIILIAHHWRALLDWMGNPEELADPELDIFIQRLIQRERIEPVIERFFQNFTKIDAAREAQRRGIPVTPLLKPAEVLENEHTRARGTFHKLEVAEGRAALLPSGFVTIDGERIGPSSGPPRLASSGERQAWIGRDEASRRALFEAPSRGPSDDGHPFRGLRVIDFGVGAVGVEVARLLAEFGADVIKIETKTAPDFIRVILNSYMNPSFASSSRCKRSFGVDVKTQRGRELVYELIRGADVVIENSAPGTMSKLGFGPAKLREINPRIIGFSSQMVGTSGPWKGWIGYGPSTHPVSGLQYLWNFPEDEAQPAGSTNVYPDHYVGRLGTFAVLAGLVGRERHGHGIHVDAAQFESAVGLLGDLFARESMEAGSVKPQGNASERGAPWGAYQCAGDEEWCVVNVRSDAEWGALGEALGNPDWVKNPEYTTVTGRLAAREDLDRQLGAWTSLREPREVMETLQAHGVPAGIVAHPGHHFVDPQLLERGFLRPVDQPGDGHLIFDGTPFCGSGLPEPMIGPAPQLGEHTRDVARELLGLSDADIEALIAEGVLEDPPEGTPA